VLPYFIILDPSLRTPQGHHQPYDRRVSAAAARAGYVPLVASNLKFAITPDLPPGSKSVYRFYEREMPPHTRLFRGYLAVRSWCSRRTGGRLAEDGAFFGRLNRALWRIDFERRFRMKKKAFIADTLAALPGSDLPGGSVVFMPNATLLDTVFVRALTEARPGLARAEWHLLFHEDVYFGLTRLPLDKPETYAALHDQARDARGSRVHFHANTEELARDLQSVGVSTVRALPIPLPEIAKSVSDDAGRPLRVAYLGNARAEKGFQHLPRVVEEVGRARAGRRPVHFVIQSTLTPVAEYEQMKAARAALDAPAVRDRVSCFEQPSPDDYLAQLCASDIVLMPYDGPAYFARASYIMAEALAAGIPAVVPHASTMAGWIKEAVYAHLDGLPDGKFPILGKLEGRSFQPLETSRELAVNPHARRPTRVTARGISVTVPVPPGAARLLLSFAPSAEDRGGVAMVDVAPRGGAPFRRVILFESSRFRPAMVADVPAGATALDVFCSADLVPAGLDVRSLRIEFAGDSERPVPLSAVGVVFSEPGDLAAAICEIADYYEHYRSTALAFSEAWKRRHNPDALIRALTGRTAADAAAAISGGSL
jgi:hypothetical protein